MINVQFDEADFINLLMDRLKFWNTDKDVLELYKDYLENLIYGGCFDGGILDIDVFIDNLYVNDTTIMDKEDLEKNDIDIDDYDKILAKNEDNDLYLVSSY